MPGLDQTLKIQRCPHCSVDNPNLILNTSFATDNDTSSNRRIWAIYSCKRCGGVVTAMGDQNGMNVARIYPSVETANDILPSRVKSFLQQAMDCTFAPAGSVILSGSAVDAMLKEKSYKEGSLYKRIEQAINNHLLTPEMGTWAHQVRLDANDQRHADDDAELPTVEDAKQAVEFAKTLAEFLFVLPSKVSRGIAASNHDEKLNAVDPNGPETALKNSIGEYVDKWAIG